MLVSLNARESIGAVSLGKYLHDPTLKKRFNKGQLLELGGTSIPFESLSKKHINVWVSAGMEPLDQANEERFKALGIQWIPNYDWREEHPLGKAEWLLFFGAITNRFDEAELQFKSICKRYNKFNKLPKGNSCQKILVGNFAGDYWYSPLQNSFQAHFFNQVDFCTFSMNYKGTGSMAVGAERIYQEAEACELWLNPGFPTKQAILNAFPKAIQLRPFTKGSIFCYSHDLNKFWEQSALMPDIVLRDLIRIKQGNSADAMLYFYREVK
jgi:iron complex transport system substrate-binding protein